MLRRFRNVILVLPIALGACISSASAAHTTLPGCNNPADSAFNQYCDSIPSATGPQRPQVGAPTLGAAPPSQTVRQTGGTPRQIDNALRRQIGGTPRQIGGAQARRARARQSLLTLPAPGLRRAVTSSGAAITSGWSLSLPMIVILVAVALALLGIAVARWRRQRSET